MADVQRMFGDEKFITGSNGVVESVIMSVKEYSSIVEIIEDYKLGQLIKAEENTDTLSKKEALEFLNLD